MDGQVVVQFGGGDHKGMEAEIAFAGFVMAFELILAHLVDVELGDGRILIEPDHEGLGIAGFGDEDIHNAKLIDGKVNGIAMMQPVADGFEVIIGSELNGTKGNVDAGPYYLLVDSRMKCARI